MIEHADVFVTNLRDGGLARFRADAGSLLAVNPRLVYCRGAGFGMRGPLADDPCQDTVGMAFAGFMDSTSPTDVPHYPPGSMSDILTGIQHGRRRAGRPGQAGASPGRAAWWGRRRRRRCCGSSCRPPAWPPTWASTWSGSRTTPPPTRSSPSTRRPTAGSPSPRSSRRTGRPSRAPSASTTSSTTPGSPSFAAVQVPPRRVPPRLRRPPPHDADRALVAGAAGRRRLGLAGQPAGRPGRDEHILANDYLVTFDDGFIGPPSPFDVDGLGRARARRRLRRAQRRGPGRARLRRGADHRAPRQGGHLVAGTLRLSAQPSPTWCWGRRRTRRGAVSPFATAAGR